MKCRFWTSVRKNSTLLNINASIEGHLNPDCGKPAPFAVPIGERIFEL
jgi:hypothetical protein